MNSPSSHFRTMRGLMSPSALPQPRMARPPRPMAAPQIPKVPKVQQLKQIMLSNNGARAVHHYASGPSKAFSFRRPTDLATHIKRVQNSEWLHPNVGRSSGKIDKLLDIG